MSENTQAANDSLVTELIQKGAPGIETAVRAAEEVESVYYKAIAATTPDIRVRTEAKAPHRGVTPR